jgi:eIF-2B alpha/beta/delta-like uncharacterized protein
VLWIATAWLATGLYIAPAISGHEPKFQRLGVNFLFTCLLVIVIGGFAGQWFAVMQKMGLGANFWFGHQGYEYIDLGRFWQIFLFVGLFVWLALMTRGARILTHCNAGALATGGYGTALGVVRAAHAADPTVSVIVDETRPLLQGSRLTAWELQQEAIPYTLISDNMAAMLMSQGRVTHVVVGADRIAANGDVVNKIGTYGVAILAREHGIPFIVAAPTSTLDLSMPSAAEIPVEERAADEVRGLSLFGRPAASPDAPVANPAFDRTPARLVSAIVTEQGVHRAPYERSLRRAWDSAAH